MSIEVKNLSFSYNERPFVKNLSFNVSKNQIGLISGVSGVGKTSLLNIISGLKMPDSGTIPVSYTHLTLPTIFRV